MFRQGQVHVQSHVVLRLLIKMSRARGPLTTRASPRGQPVAPAWSYVDISSPNNILDINERSLAAAVEPNVAMPRPPTDCIPLSERLFRYGRGGFWIDALAFPYFGSRLRFPLPRLRSRAAAESAGIVVQDRALPWRRAGGGVCALGRRGAWGSGRCGRVLCGRLLFLVPVPRQFRGPQMHYRGGNGNRPAEGMPDIGLWGKAEGNAEGSVRQSRELENKLAELGGKKRYEVTTLSSVWDKVHLDAENMKVEEVN
ncbi:hypothetical protein VTK26DRAFT_382 [Humicola hyalothermophila]